MVKGERTLWLAIAAVGVASGMSAAYFRSTYPAITQFESFGIAIAIGVVIFSAIVFFFFGADENKEQGE